MIKMNNKNNKNRQKILKEKLKKRKKQMKVIKKRTQILKILLRAIILISKKQLSDTAEVEADLKPNLISAKIY